MSKRTKIFSLIECPILGSLGPQTQVKSRVVCRTCDRVLSVNYKKIEYVFDGWEKEDIAKASLENVYIVTSKVRDAIREAKLTGISVDRRIVATPSELFTSIYADRGLPTFYELAITSTLEGGGWFEKDGSCEECGLPFYKNTPVSRRWIASPSSDEPFPSRVVEPENWRNEDMFFLTEPGPPIITERLLNVFQKQKVANIRVEPARWSS